MTLSKAWPAALMRHAGPHGPFIRRPSNEPGSIPEQDRTSRRRIRTSLKRLITVESAPE